MRGLSMKGLHPECPGRSRQPIKSSIFGSAVHPATIGSQLCQHRAASEGLSVEQQHGTSADAAMREGSSYAGWLSEQALAQTDATMRGSWSFLQTIPNTAAERSGSPCSTSSSVDAYGPSPVYRQANCGSICSEFSSLATHEDVQHKPVKVFVMLPLDTVNQDGVFRYAAAPWFLRALNLLAQSGVYGVAVDVWWGAVEQQPQQYCWSGYKQLFEMVRATGLKVQVVLSFHACGGNVGDVAQVPLPHWVLKAGEQDPDLFFTDRPRGYGFGQRNREYISIFADDAPGVLCGRSPIQCYEDLMASFRGTFSEELRGLVEEVVVGAGPCGELRYPSYVEANGWRFPGIGEFQCYDRRALASLAQAAREAGHSEWGYTGPHDCGDYNSTPDVTGFFSNGGSWETPYGAFFLQWYSGALVAHGDRLLSAAARIFRSPCSSPTSCASLVRTSTALSRQLSLGSSSITSRTATSTSNLTASGCHPNGRLSGINMDDAFMGPEDAADYDEASPVSGDGPAKGQRRLQATPKGRRVGLLGAGGFQSSSTIMADSGDCALVPSPSCSSLASDPLLGGSGASAPELDPASSQASDQTSDQTDASLPLPSPCVSLDGGALANLAGLPESASTDYLRHRPPTVSEQAALLTSISLPGGRTSWEGAATAAALPVLAGSPRSDDQHVTLTLKVAGIHWWYKSVSHAAELTAGYYNTHGRCGYRPIMELCARHGANLTLTCVEMCDEQHPHRAQCGPEGLLQQIRAAAAEVKVTLSGENALPIFLADGVDTVALDRIVTNTRSLARRRQQQQQQQQESGAYCALQPGSGAARGNIVSTGRQLVDSAKVAVPAGRQQAQQQQQQQQPLRQSSSFAAAGAQAAAAAGGGGGGATAGRAGATAAGASVASSTSSRSSSEAQAVLPGLTSFTFLRLCPEILQPTYQVPWLRFIQRMNGVARS